MSSQYEQAANQRDRHSNKDPNWITIAIVGFVIICVIVISVSFFGGSSGKSKRDTEFQKTLFEQTNGLLDVNYFLISGQDKNQRYFLKLRKYIDQIYHRFEIIAEFIDSNDVPVDQKKLIATENGYRKKIDLIQENSKDLIAYHDSLKKMKQTLPKLLAQNTEINNRLLEDNASNNHIYYVTRQLFLIERITNNINDLGTNLNDSNLIITAADRMGRDMALLIRVYRGLLKGDYKMNVSKINNLKVRVELNKASKLAMTLSNDISIVLENGPEAFQFLDTRNALLKDSEKLQKNYQALFFYKD